MKKSTENALINAFVVCAFVILSAIILAGFHALEPSTVQALGGGF